MNGNRIAFILHDNAHGLSRDAKILRDILEPMGWEITIGAPHQPVTRPGLFKKPTFDIVVHFETCHPKWLGAGKSQILIPNPEWFDPDLARKLRHFDVILSKTHMTSEIFGDLRANVFYVGFTSSDRYKPDVPKDWMQFFHLAGASVQKGTEDLLFLWKKHPEWPELTIVQRKEFAPPKVPSNVNLITEHLDDDALATLQNNCGMHLCPSRSEGWGHHLVEAMSCGSVVLTTNAPPMNEFITPENGFLVDYDLSVPRKSGTDYYASLRGLRVGIKEMIALSDADKRQKSELARSAFSEIGDNFQQKIRQVFTH